MMSISVFEMKTGFLSFASVIALTAVSATAGGYTPPVVQPTVAPVITQMPVQAGNWAGAYVGGNLSWGKAKVKGTDRLIDGASDLLSDYFDEPIDAGALLSEAGLGRTFSKPDGFGGAIRAGYDWQSGSVVYGLGGEYNLGKIDGGLESGWRNALDEVGELIGEDVPDINFKISKAATLFGRVGYAAGDWMPYALVGYTWADGKVSALGESVSADLKGATVGIGAERRFGNNWSGYGEFTYTDFGDVKDADKLIKVNMNQVKFGVNYRF